VYALNLQITYFAGSNITAREGNLEPRKRKKKQAQKAKNRK
jgi:hypothetical protein